MAVGADWQMHVNVRVPTMQMGLDNLRTGERALVLRCLRRPGFSQVEGDHLRLHRVLTDSVGSGTSLSETERDAELELTPEHTAEPGRRAQSTSSGLTPRFHGTMSAAG
jgi:hypothetical protein